jgi:RNA polymerase sigma factor (sigma-70 family)
LRNTAVCVSSPNGETELPFPVGEAIPVELEDGPSGTDSGIESDVPFQFSCHPERVVIDFARMVRHLARKSASNRVTEDDLFQIGMIAALSAARRFEAGKKALRWWIYMKVNYAIADASRSDKIDCWRESQMPESSSANFLNLCSRSTALLDGEDKAGRASPTLGLEMRGDIEAEKIDLVDAMSLLTERQESLVRMVYFGGMSMAEAGRNFNITRERARQIHDEALGGLREGMRDKAEGEEPAGERLEVKGNT